MCYALLQRTTSPNTLALLAGTWYFVDGAFTWSDDPNRATKLCKRDALYWLKQAESTYDKKTCKHELINYRVVKLKALLEELGARVAKAKAEGCEWKYRNAKRQILDTKNKLKRLDDGDQKLLLTQCR